MADPQIKVEFNEQDKRRIMELLDDVIEIRRQVWRGLNFGAKRGRKLAVDEIGSQITLPKKHIRDHVKIKQKANKGHAVASFEIKGSPISLSLYKHRAGKRGVAFTIWQGGSREIYRHAFKLHKGNGGKGRIVERDIGNPNYDGRLPLKEKFGPAIPNVFDKTPGLANKAMEKAMADAMVEMERLVALALEDKI
jgi:hypothetical protein